MAEWATMHREQRSSALRRSLTVRVRRTLAIGLLATSILGGAALPASAAPPSAALSRDISGPGVGGERDAEVTAVMPGATRPPVAQGKATRVAEIQRQGSVVAVFEDPADPLIVIAVENGYVTVRLRCGSLCPSIHLGDYVVAEGERRSEAVLDAVDVWVAAP